MSRTLKSLGLCLGASTVSLVQVEQEWSDAEAPATSVIAHSVHVHEGDPKRSLRRALQIWVCREMMRVAKAGYFETPTRIIESTPGVERIRYCGYSHHHWLCEAVEGGIQFTFKHAQIHAYSRFHVTVGPSWLSGRREHHTLEVFDGLYGLLAVGASLARDAYQT